MTREEVIALATQAGWQMPIEWDLEDGFSVRLERFANLVATAEREACLKIIERYQATKDSYPTGDLSGAWMVTAFEEIKATIRARGCND